MRPLTAVALLALFLASLAGCGGGDGDGIPATVWLEEADAVCRANEVAAAPDRARIEGLVRTGIRTPEERAAAVSVLHRSLSRLELEIAKLRELEPPAGEEAATAAAIVGGLAEKRIIGEELIQALESGSDPDEERVVRKLFANEVDTERLSRRIGLRVCGHI
jgi:hypothetical protein